MIAVEEWLTMRVLFVQHDHVSPTGPIGDAFRRRGFDVETLVVVPSERHLTPNVNVAFPDPSSFDVVVSMGAPWSVYDQAKIGNWLSAELDMLRTATAAGVPVLGICFGAQALAAALGGRVVPASRPEIGWTNVRTKRPDTVAGGPWFEWHSDKWELPAAAEPVAWSEVSEQAFIYGNCLGVQFHPELTPSMLTGWLSNGGEVYLRDLGIDTERLRTETVAHADAAAVRADDLVDAFLSRIGSCAPVNNQRPRDRRTGDG